MNAKFKKFADKKFKNPDHHTIIGMDDCNEPITILLGPNGTGKSMSLLSIEADCKKRGIDCIRYSNKKNDIVTHSAFDPYKLSCAFHSEGERICDSFDYWSQTELLSNLLTHERSIYILIDELDSGLSPDKLGQELIDIMHVLSLERNKHRDRDIKIIFTCNTWEMLDCFKGTNTLTYWIPTKEKIDTDKLNFETWRNMYMEYYTYMRKKQENNE